MKGNSLFVFISNIQTVSKGSKVYFFPKIIDFFEIEVYGQTVLSDRSILIRRKNSVKNAKIGKFKCDFFGDFQALWKTFLYASI